MSTQGCCAQSWALPGTPPAPRCGWDTDGDGDGGTGTPRCQHPHPGGHCGVLPPTPAGCHPGGTPERCPTDGTRPLRPFGPAWVGRGKGTVGRGAGGPHPDPPVSPSRGTAGAAGPAPPDGCGSGAESSRIWGNQLKKSILSGGNSKFKHPADTTADGSWGCVTRLGTPRALGGSLSLILGGCTLPAPSAAPGVPRPGAALGVG